MEEQTRAAELGEPFRRFGEWMERAMAAGVAEPTAMALATADAQARPSVRMVLLKGFDERGFVFFTGYDSRKARELTENARAALLFSWDLVGRQVRIEGPVERVARDESEAYFRSRPRASQLSAWASRQSLPIASRDELEAAVGELERRFEGREVPLPPEWGGFRLAPRAYEFWQHRDDRLHDRLRYRRSSDGWVIERLSP